MPLVNDMLRRRRLNELINSWVEYRDMIARHAGQGAAAPEHERRYLDLQAAISARLPILQEFSVGHGSLNQDVQSQIRGMSEFMNRFQNLSGNGSFDDSVRQDFMTRWHSYFLFLNRFKGLQNPVQRRGPRDAYAPIASPGITWGGRRLVAGIFDNWFTRFVLRAAVVVLAVVVVARLVNFDFTNAGASAKRIYNEWWGPAGTAAGQTVPAVSPGPTKKTTGTGAKSAAGATSAVPATEKGKRSSGNAIVINGDPEDRPVYHVDGKSDFVPPQGDNPMRKALAVIRDVTPRPLRDFMRPVTSQWGVEATVAMVGVGLLLVAYMLFGRAR